jgi:flagellar biogenesis protein FliO
VIFRRDIGSIAQMSPLAASQTKPRRLVCEAASGRSLIVAVSLLLLSLPAFAQSTRPAAFEDEPLKIDVPHRAAIAPSTATDSRSAGSTTSDAQRVGLALAVVIGAIFALKWASKKIFLLPGNARGGKGIKLLSRSVLAPKQQVLLLQVGNRVIVVGDSGGHMTALCEVNDPDEVAALVGEVSQASESPKRSFGKLFGKARQSFEETATDDEVDSESLGNVEPVTELGVAEHADIGGLMEKIRGMQRQFRK